MTCKGILNTLSDYLEGDTASVVCNEIEKHLDGCEKCRMHVDTMRAVVTLFKGWRGDTIPDDVSGRLREAIAETVERASRRSSGKSPACGASTAKPARPQAVKVKKKTCSAPAKRGKPAGKSSKPASKPSKPASKPRKPAGKPGKNPKK